MTSKVYTCVSLVVTIKPVRLTIRARDTREIYTREIRAVSYLATTDPIHTMSRSYSTSIRLILRGEPVLSLPADRIDDVDGPQPADIVDGKKSGYRKNGIKKKKIEKPKAYKAKAKQERNTIDSESDADTVILIHPCETVLPSEDELFTGILPAGDYEIFDLDDLVTTPWPERKYPAWHSTMTSASSYRSDDELLGAILTSANLLIGGSV